MKLILKYKAPLFNEHWSLNLPEGAKVLTVQEQHGTWVLWALVDTDKPIVERNFIAVFTGQETEVEAAGYICTIQHDETGLVFHIFEEVKQTLRLSQA